ncbi:hypothetical protein [Geotoga petraea]|uniref:Uncharacterized protein n=1 Tax=Geotoga petraea TaxID=28234 RepID=A0A1G6MMM7_9BACT|nr:hypothetical protein [Geotoga petraea]TGG85834.1 hypothetical protein E4650_10210 [Geotoga petraea]SDC56731.1 hypothetical protein SAMN04488588_1311 [Geotoga petraea]
MNNEAILNKIYKDKYIEIAIEAYKLYIETDNYKMIEKNVDDMNIKNFCKNFEINFEDFEVKDLKLIIDNLSEKYSLSKSEIKTFLQLMSDENEYKFNIYTAIKYLSHHSQLLYKLKNNESDLLVYINDLDYDYLKSLKDKYANNEKVNKIRHEVIEHLLENKKININTLENIKDNIEKQYDKNILHSWNNFTILFPLYYYKFQFRVQNELYRISDFIKSINKINEQKLKEKIVGFFGGQNFGNDSSWLVLYPENNKSHKNSQLLAFAVENKEIKFGLDFGNNIKKERDMEKVNVDHIDFDITNKMKEKYLQVYNEFINFKQMENKYDENIIKTFIQFEFIEPIDIFFERVKKYI